MIDWTSFTIGAEIGALMFALIMACAWIIHNYRRSKQLEKGDRRNSL